MLRLLAALLLTFPLLAADLQVTIEAPDRVDWGVTFPYRVTIYNAGADTAVDVRLSIGSPTHGPCFDQVAIRQPSESVMALPVIASARFEDGATIIEGTVAMSGTWSGVSLYANDAPDDSGYGEGQYYLGQAHVISGKFTMRHNGDLRGKWVAATKTEYQYFGWLRSEGSDYSTWTTTGEFSRAVEVH